MRLLSKLSSKLGKTSSNVASGITGIFTKAKLDQDTLDELEDLLIMSDMGARVAADITSKLADTKLDKDISPEEVRAFLASEIETILTPAAKPLNIEDAKPCVVLVVGVNGNGKTTTIGKLAHYYQGQGKKVMLAAADTFRAAAVEQLEVWGQRNNVPVITGPQESDPASVAFKACEAAQEQGVDILFIDTAGRLHNKANLMQELSKIRQVITKKIPEAPHHTIQVLDATTGQNALVQIQAFSEMTDITGIILTKLDGTAKGGVAVALAKQSTLPIHAIGIGEQIQDLGAFDPAELANSLVGTES